VTGASVSEFLGEFAALRGADVTADEAKKAQASRRMGMMQSFAGLRGIVDAGATLVRNDRPFSALAEELALIAQATEADLNRLATKAPLLERGLLVLVGDGKLIREQMIGIPIREPVERTVTGDAKLLNPDE
jgi:predicted Zn-dependent peptidase